MPGESWMYGQADDSKQYIDMGRWPFIHDKRPVDYTLDKMSISADGVEYAILGGESGSTASVHGHIIELTEPLEIDADMPGTITITLSHPLRLDTVVTIEAMLP